MCWKGLPWAPGWIGESGQKRRQGRLTEVLLGGLGKSQAFGAAAAAPRVPWKDHDTSLASAFSSANWG